MTAQAGADRRAVFERIMAAHERLVLATAYRLLGHREDAQDAAQEVFLRLYRNLHKLGVADPRAWLYRVTVNVCRDVQRRRVPQAELDPDYPAGNPSADAALSFEERKKLVTRGLEELPERQRAMVVLRDIEGLSTKEVARILGVAEVTVRSQISMARLRLKKFVDEFLRRRV